MCAKQFHLGGRDADAVLGSQGMYVGGRTLVKGLQWTHLFLWNPATHHTLNRKLCRYTLKSSQDHQEKNVLWCRELLGCVRFPLICLICCSGPMVIMIQTLVMLITIELVLMIMIDLVMVLVIMTMVKFPPQYQGDLLR